MIMTIINLEHEIVIVKRLYRFYRNQVKYMYYFYFEMLIRY